MSITFHCEHCHKKIEAPDSAGGRRGKCPYCGGSNYIPDPTAADQELDLAPLDEEEERRREQEIQRLMAEDQGLLGEGASAEETPRLSQRDAREIGSADLHHLVINYVLDMFAGQLERADANVLRMNEFPRQARQAVKDVLEGEVSEPALKPVPSKVLEGFLKNLAARLR